MRIQNLLSATLGAGALVVLLLAVPTLGAAGASTTASAEAFIESVIVQGTDAQTVANLVENAGGQVTRELAVINAVSADLTQAQLERLRQENSVARVWRDRKVTVAGKKTSTGGKGGGGGSSDTNPDTHYPTLVGAAELHTRGIDGYGVTVAVLDTGLGSFQELQKAADGHYRILAQHVTVPGYSSTTDDSGHGTHITGIIGNSNKTSDGQKGKFLGIAPNADLVIVKAFDVSGQVSYSSVIEAVDWIVANQAAYGIRVLNLSFSAPLNPTTGTTL